MRYKEILHNVAKHSQATQIQIKLKENEEGFHLEVVDDGIGFDEKNIYPLHGDGITNLKRHAKEIGSVLKISSKPGKGTNIFLNVKT